MTKFIIILVIVIGIVYCISNKIHIKWIDSEELNEEKLDLLNDVDGILIPGGFGSRGIDGKIRAISYAREKQIPFLGICLGMQLSIIEFLRNKAGIKEANSIEFDKNTTEPAIYLIEDFIDRSGKTQIRTHQSPMGGTMRLGEYECKLKKDSIIYQSYGNCEVIKERHRHRYEANPKYQEILEKNGMSICAEGKEGLIEAVEIKNHPFFVAVQFHPEFTSRLQNPNAIILAFAKKALEYKK